MNKLCVGLLLAASLFLIDVSPAAAHAGVERSRMHYHDYRAESPRRYEMPKWLKRNKRFRHWYRHTPLRRYRQIGWNQLFEIYRWERRYFGSRDYVDVGYDRRFSRPASRP